MTLSLIVAASQNGVIGNKGKLPWRLPADLERFKQITLGHPILMGRKTFDSLGKPLPGRTNIIITRNKNLKIRGALTAPSLEDAIRLCRNDEELFVIGGASIYEQALPLADRIYLTRIHRDFEGDTLLPEMDSESWKEISRQDFHDPEENPLPFSCLVLERCPRQRS